MKQFILIAKRSDLLMEIFFCANAKTALIIVTTER